MPGLARLAGPVLIGDIGGTHARFAIVPEDGGVMRRFKIVRTREHAGIEEAAVAAAGRAEIGARSAFLAVAAPIRGDRIALTNCDWVVEPMRMMARLGLESVVLINDFEAQALALPGHVGDVLDIVSPGKRTERGTKLVIGPGTGLGAAALVDAGGRWMPVPGEGGHVDLAPRDERDVAIWREIGGRISAETVVSGPGLVRLYRAISALNGVAPTLEKPPEIPAAADAGSDPAAVEAVDRFLAHLGAFAGNIALVYLPHGGVYLGGGIVLHLRHRIGDGLFLSAFRDKAPYREMMESFFVAAVTTDTPALSGLADVLRRPDRYAVPVEGRVWSRG